eukprot:TRINITY_DN16088_c0_g1_i2.p1 TRINITY_DN16088_c0_g1~~TRINITY_DN16088_c0_g1_i2.p1  ORF type:complete len:176 (-),score=5.24 TRINITY_DN16088_c0_g1_i2:285-791(-)
MCIRDRSLKKMQSNESCGSSEHNNSHKYDFFQHKLNISGLTSQMASNQFDSFGTPLFKQNFMFSQQPQQRQFKQGPQLNLSANQLQNLKHSLMSENLQAPVSSTTYDEFTAKQSDNKRKNKNMSRNKKSTLLSVDYYSEQSFSENSSPEDLKKLVFHKRDTVIMQQER